MKNKKLVSIYKKLYKSFGPQNWWPGDTPFEVAVGAILTQNTNWGNVEKAINNLKKEKVLNAKAIHDMPVKKLALLIQPSGYFNIKAKRLKSFINFLMNAYHGSMKKMGSEEIHSLRKKLLDVNGMGPETADSILLYVLDKPIFVIDAYTKRVLSRHNILGHDEAYDKFQELFHSAFKKDVRLFNEYHALFVRVGKEFCKPKPVCEGCPLK
ncbi:MAG: endonuclease [Nitrospirae bacterium RIFOXYB2_FULL_43_5]|nr:MAG: endonuclease [Nitrospirae bacterium GWF2_44_13]OGW64006.1 MAG: endonuclease [Nitrospirae bacterium RIFOXYA2_FULL_44_9]OGW74225.1 MAG: endonuclease [Nitrospirae bacterium RIFOXYB2_FULL_43_5]HBG92992.1 endonuclease [Nitrospiraceae bacterium]HBU05093.1 endonuclease [Nitrospiraceae bacterium]